MNSALPPSRMSVPRPAMLVAIVTVPRRPACATISASCSWYFAFRTSCLIAAPLEQRPTASPISRSRRCRRATGAQSPAGDDLVQDRVVLLALGPVDDVRLFLARERPVRRHDDDVELVDLVELFRFGIRRAGHAGQLLVLAEVVLEGDGRERLVLALDLDLLFRLDRLVQAVAPSPSRHQAAGELVDDDDLAVLDHVFDVALEQRVRPQRLLDVVEQRHVRRVVHPGRPGTRRCASICSDLAMPVSVSCAVLCFSSTR